jgi:uncharacterized protein YbjQ (UPF0145 family)
MDMRELNMVEVDAVGGAGIIRSIFEDIRYVIGELPDAYRDAIGSATELMCIATDNC